MCKCCFYNGIRGFRNLLQCYKDFENFCNSDSYNSNTAIELLSHLEDCLKKLVEFNNEFFDDDSDLVEDINSLIDSIGFKFSGDSTLTEMLSEHLDLLESIES